MTLPPPPPLTPLLPPPLSMQPPPPLLTLPPLTPPPTLGRLPPLLPIIFHLCACSVSWGISTPSHSWALSISFSSGELCFFILFFCFCSFLTFCEAWSCQWDFLLTTILFYNS